MRNARNAASLPCLLAAAAALVVAPAAHALELTDYPQIGQFIEEVAERHDFAPAALERLLREVELKPEVVTTMERPGEALPWHEYRKGFITELHVKRGLAYWHEHEATLERAYREYGVPPEVVLGVLGVETQYGRNHGRYRVLDALVTLWLHYPPRQEFFRRELEEFLVLAREARFDPARVKGSYAGALGIPQFIPSSYRRYAVDFDGDGRRDLIASPADAIGSVANFLRLHGWEADAPVSEPARLEGTHYFWVEKLGARPALRLAELATYGIFPAAPAESDRRAALIALDGEDGPIYRLGYENFYAITRYNRSKHYAMAVQELAEMLRRAHNEEAATP
jgi:membrane-bound lytic murein transglycosylase B